MQQKLTGSIIKNSLIFGFSSIIAFFGLISFINNNFNWAFLLICVAAVITAVLSFLKAFVGKDTLILDENGIQIIKINKTRLITWKQLISADLKTTKFEKKIHKSTVILNVRDENNNEMVQIKLDHSYGKKPTELVKIINQFKNTFSDPLASNLQGINEPN